MIGGTIDLAFLRDGDPTDGIEINTLVDLAMKSGAGRMVASNFAEIAREPLRK